MGGRADVAHTGVSQHYLDRLTNSGIEVAQTNVTVDELWAATSTATLAFLRPGKHLCVSWRMIDHLAMGCCSVCDRPSYAQWPVPLRNNHEFVDCECGIGWDESLPDKADYARIADTVMALLPDPESTAAIRRTPTVYFDAHVAPERIARYPLDTAEQSLIAPP